MNRNKRGYIQTSKEIIESDDWEVLCPVLFSKFFPNYMYIGQDNRSYIFVGFCEDFEEIGEGDKLPRYDVVFTTKQFRDPTLMKDYQELTVSFKRY